LDENIGCNVDKRNERKMGSLLDETLWMKTFQNGISQLAYSLFVLFLALKEYYSSSFLCIDGSQ
jgi:hypothetical protein